MDAWASSSSPWDDARADDQTCAKVSPVESPREAPSEAERVTSTLPYEPDPWAEPSPFAGPPSPVAVQEAPRSSPPITATSLDTADPWQSDGTPSQWGSQSRQVSIPSLPVIETDQPAWSPEASRRTFQSSDGHKPDDVLSNGAADPWLSERQSEIESPLPTLQDISLGGGTEWGGSSYAQPQDAPPSSTASPSTMPARLSDLPISFTSVTGSALVGGQKAQMDAHGVLTARDVQIQKEEDERARQAEAAEKEGGKENAKEEKTGTTASRFAAALASWRKPAAKQSDDTSRAPPAAASLSPKADGKKLEPSPAAKKGPENTSAGVGAVISGLFAKSGPPPVVDAADDDEEDDDDDVPIATIAQRHAHSRQASKVSAGSDFLSGDLPTSVASTSKPGEAEGTSAVKRFLGRWQKPAASSITNKDHAAESKGTQDEDWGQWLDGVATKSASIDGGSRTSGPSMAMFDEQFVVAPAAPLAPSQIQAARTLGGSAMTGSRSTAASARNDLDLSAFDTLGALPALSGRSPTSTLSRSQSLQQSSRHRGNPSNVGIGHPQSSLARNSAAAAAAASPSRVFSNASTATSGSMAGSDDAFGDFGVPSSLASRPDNMSGPAPAGVRRGRYAQRSAEPTRAAVKSWATGPKRHSRNDPDPAWDWEQSDDFADGGGGGSGVAEFADDPHADMDDFDDLPSSSRDFGSMHDPHPHAEVYDEEDLHMASGPRGSVDVEQTDSWDWETAPLPRRVADVPPTPPSKVGHSFGSKRSSPAPTLSHSTSSPQPTIIMAPAVPGGLPKLAPPPRIKPPPGASTRIAAPPSTSVHAIGTPQQAMQPPPPQIRAPLAPSISATATPSVVQQQQQQQRMSLSQGKGLTNDDLSFFENL